MKKLFAWVKRIISGNMVRDPVDHVQKSILTEAVIKAADLLIVKLAVTVIGMLSSGTWYLLSLAGMKKGITQDFQIRILIPEWGLKDWPVLCRM